ncbi:RNase H domain-containing protein [Trichonephila clavipes]|nr:RNase H domain-containing protein [Trichonephila clavipes]
MGDKSTGGLLAVVLVFLSLSQEMMTTSLWSDTLPPKLPHHINGRILSLDKFNVIHPFYKAGLNPKQELWIHFEWIPSYVNIAGNEIADCLARAGAGDTTTPAAPLTYLELFSRYKANNKVIWIIPPVHLWYQSKCPGGSLVRSSSRRNQNALTRFLSGHLMSLTFIDGIKHFEICTKFSSTQASPGHILSCLRLTRQDLVQDPLLVLDFSRVNGLMDLI